MYSSLYPLHLFRSGREIRNMSPNCQSLSVYTPPATRGTISLHHSKHSLNPCCTAQQHLSPYLETHVRPTANRVRLSCPLHSCHVRLSHSLFHLIFSQWLLHARHWAKNSTMSKLDILRKVISGRGMKKQIIKTKW